MISLQLQLCRKWALAIILLLPPPIPPPRPCSAGLDFATFAICGRKDKLQERWRKRFAVPILFTYFHKTSLSPNASSCQKLARKHQKYFIKKFRWGDRFEKGCLPIFLPGSLFWSWPSPYWIPICQNGLMKTELIWKRKLEICPKPNWNILSINSNNFSFAMFEIVWSIGLFVESGKHSPGDWE